MPFEQKRIDHENGIVVLALNGTLTMGNQLMKLEWTIEELLKEQHNRIVLDFSEIAYLDSSAIGVIINCRGKVSAANGQLRLAKLSERVTAIFNIAKIYDLLSPDASTEDAISQLNSGS